MNAAVFRRALAFSILLFGSCRSEKDDREFLGRVVVAPRRDVALNVSLPKNKKDPWSLRFSGEFKDDNETERITVFLVNKSHEDIQFSLHPETKNVTIRATEKVEIFEGSLKELVAKGRGQDREMVFLSSGDHAVTAELVFRTSGEVDAALDVFAFFYTFGY